MRTIWFELHARALRQAPRAMRGWLTYSGSLTRALTRQHGAKPQVEVLRESAWDKIGHDEATLLGRQAGRGWVREVSLCHQGHTLLLARTVVMHGALMRAPRLRGLGNQALGALLFNHRDTARWSVRQIAPLRPLPPALQTLTNSYRSRARDAWMRRTVYWLQRTPLLVTEVFMPRLHAPRLSVSVLHASHVCRSLIRTSAPRAHRVSCTRAAGTTS